MSKLENLKTTPVTEQENTPNEPILLFWRLLSFCLLHFASYYDYNLFLLACWYVSFVSNLDQLILSLFFLQLTPE